MDSLSQHTPLFSNLQLVFFPAEPQQYDVGKLWTALTSAAPVNIQQVPAEGISIAQGQHEKHQLLVQANAMRVELRVTPEPTVTSDKLVTGTTDFHALLGFAQPLWRALLPHLGGILRVGVVATREIEFAEMEGANRRITSYLPYQVDPDVLAPMSDLAFQYNERLQASDGPTGEATNILSRHAVQNYQSGFFNPALGNFPVQMRVSYSVTSVIDVNNAPLTSGVQGDKATELVEWLVQQLAKKMDAS